MSTFRVLQSPPDTSSSTETSKTRVRCLSEHELEKWDVFAAGHPHGLIYHLSSWKTILEKSFPHITGYFLVLEDSASGGILAGVPVYLVRSWLLGNRLVSSPYATLSDPLITSSEDLPLLLEGLNALRSNVQARRVEVRSFQTAGLLAECAIDQLQFYKQHSLSLDSSWPQLTASFSRTAVRRMISKAEKHGVRIHTISSQDGLHQFYRLLSMTRRKLQLPAIPERFFANLWDAYHPRSLVGFLAVQGSRPVAAALALRFNGVFCLEYSGEDLALDAPGANQLLYLEAIRHAHSVGDRLFHFGRTAATNPGLLQYKRHWGTVEADLPIFYLPHSPQQAAETSPAYHLMKGLIRFAPASAQRLIGDFCYRHLG